MVSVLQLLWLLTEVTLPHCHPTFTANNDRNRTWLSVVPVQLARPNVEVKDAKEDEAFQSYLPSMQNK